MRSLFVLPLVLACLAALPPSALPAPARAPAFYPARIHADYQAGEFEKVIRALEAFRESGRRCRKADSVFLEKHLAVVYAADPKTRERGRYHMLRMLALEPEADLLDMFVGEEVDGIFEKVRKESRVRRLALEKAHAAQAPSAALDLPARKIAAARTSAVARPEARPAFPEAGPAPRLKAWNLDSAPAPRRPLRRPGALRAAAAGEIDAAGAAPSLRAVRSPSAPSHRRAQGNSRRMALTAPALPAWDLDRTASSGPAMGVPPPATDLRPRPRAEASQAKPAALAPDPTRMGPRGASGEGSPEPAERPAEDAKPRWKEKGFWVGGTAVAAVLGLTAYYLGSQDWSEPESKGRTYGVAAKPNGN